MSEPLHVFIANCWHDSNKGDAAITLGTMRALSAAAPCRFTLSPCIAPRSTSEIAHIFRHVLLEYPHANVIAPALPAMFKSVRPLTLLWQGVRAVAKLVSGKVLPSNPVEREIEHADLVISKGGQYLAFPKSARLPLAHMFAFAYPLLYARRVGKPCVYYSHSIGPLHTRSLRWFMRVLCAVSDSCLVRETPSAELLKAINADSRKVAIVPDAAWAARISSDVSQILAKYSLIPGGFVAFSIRGLSVTDHVDLQKRYDESMISAIQWLVRERNLTVVLVSHTHGPTDDEDDRLATRACYDALPEDVKGQTVIIDDDLGPADLAGLYGSALFLVGTRFHALLLAMSAGSPVVAVPYFGTKTTGSFADLGLAHWVVPIESISPELVVTRIERALSDIGGERAQLSATTQRLKTQAQATACTVTDLHRTRYGLGEAWETHESR